uniref:Uncharacterized protein n=1 Tax=Panagrolaimus sp. ES5 TaxID=591445 RepID=A0AC34FTM7_9BILA
MRNSIKNWYDFTAFTSLISNNNENGFILHVAPHKEELRVTLYGCQSKKFYLHVLFQDVQKFINDIPKINDPKIKAIFFTIYSFKNENFPNNVQLCKSLKSKFEEMNSFNVSAAKIPYLFTSDGNFILTCALAAANITINVGECVLVLMILKDTFQVCDLKFTNNGYKVLRNQSLIDIDEIEDDDKLRRKILGKKKHDKILLCCDNLQNQIVATVKKVVKASSNKMTVISEMFSGEKFDGSGLVEQSKWILDNKYTKFHVIPTISARIYGIGYECGETEYYFLTTEENAQLPYAESFHAPKTCFNHFMAYMDEGTGKFVRIETFTLNGDDAHEYKITLKVDNNNFPSYSIHGINVEKITNLPHLKIDNDLWEKEPLIAFYGNYSFICLWDESAEEYKFLDSWNGQFGKPMHIAFDQEKPYFEKDAEETLGKHGKYVIDDLIYIMSRPAEDLVDSNAGSYSYAITNDNENPVLFEFDHFCGTKMLATPAFLMALLLKQHVKAIKKEIGEKPDQLAFCILNEYDFDELENVKFDLGEACQLLNIQSYTFHD